MYKYYFFIITFIVTYLSFIHGKLPSYLTKCKYGNKECIINNINTIFNQKYEGDSDIGLVKLDPLDANTITVNKDSEAIKLNIVYKNTMIYGGKNGKATKIKGFGKNPEGRHNVLFKVPTLTILSDYTIDGKMLILPINGQGRSNLTFTDVEIAISLEATAVKKNDQLYLNLERLTTDINCKNLIVNYENLFNGDKDLGDNMNKFMNENWKEIFDEVKQSYVEALNKPSFNIIKKVFDTTPYTEFFND